MLKRVLAVVMALCVTAMCIPTFAAEDIVGGGVVSADFTDDFETTDKFWSIKNMEQADAYRYGNTVTNGELADNANEKKTIKTLIAKDHTKSAEVVYKAADGKVFTSIDVNLWRQDNIRFPEIAYSIDGESWTKLVETNPTNSEGSSQVSGFKDSWTLDQSPNKENLWIALHSNIVTEVPNAKFVKVTIVENTVKYDDKRKNARIVNVALKVDDMVGGGVVSADFTDNFERLDNSWSMTNIERKDAYRYGSTVTSGELTDNANAKETIKTLIAKDHTKSAEVVYKAADGKVFTSIDVNLWRQDTIRFPEIAYSNDGETWTTLVESGEAQAYSSDGWSIVQDPGNENLWVALHKNKVTEVPNAKFVKVTIAENTVNYDNKRVNARIVNVALKVDDKVGGGVVSADFTDNFERLDNSWSMTNIERKDAYRYGSTVTSGELEDNANAKETIKTLVAKDHTKNAEIVYKAADGKVFTSIDVNLWRQDNIRFPEIAYSNDGESWTTLVESSSSQVSGFDSWTLDQSPSTENKWIALHSNKVTEVPNAKFVKVAIVENTVGYDNKRVNARIVSVELETEDVVHANELKVSAAGVAVLTDADASLEGAKLFIAEYDANDVLVNAGIYTVVLTNGGFTETLAPTTGVYFKAFVLGGESGMVPKTASATSKTAE